MINGDQNSFKVHYFEPLCHAYLSRAASIEIATITMLRRTAAPT